VKQRLPELFAAKLGDEFVCVRGLQKIGQLAGGSGLPMRVLLRMDNKHGVLVDESRIPGMHDRQVRSLALCKPRSPIGQGIGLQLMRYT
jgi:hypothetical protein